MAVVRAELKVYKSAVFNDQPTNGGRMSATESPTDVVGNLFLDAPEAERTAGSTKYRKIFFKNENDADETLANPRIYVESHTPGADEIFLFPATQVDVQSGISSPDLFGSGKLDANVSAGVSIITVLTHDSALIIFRDTETIRISDKADIDGSGNEEFHVISGTPTFGGDIATITIVGTLVNAYLATAARVQSVIDTISDLVATFASVVVVSTSGTFTSASNLTVDNIGGVNDSWTITFSSATAFDVTGTNEGAVGSGTISSTFAPTNADHSKPYFSILAAAWGGSFLSGDTVDFDTVPAAQPIWCQRSIPAGAGSLSANKAVLLLDGES